jgi:hypothetical protein
MGVGGRDDRDRDCKARAGMIVMTKWWWQQRSHKRWQNLFFLAPLLLRWSSLLAPLVHSLPPAHISLAV